jgi:site-specific recombinase XerD
MRNQSQRTWEPAPSFPALVQMFFTHYLVEQRALSQQTVAAYRDTFLLFLGFTQKHLGKPSTALLMADITPELILAFLDYLEYERLFGDNYLDRLTDM